MHVQPESRLRCVTRLLCLVQDVERAADKASGKAKSAANEAQDQALSFSHVISIMLYSPSAQARDSTYLFPAQQYQANTSVSINTDFDCALLQAGTLGDKAKNFAGDAKGKTKDAAGESTDSISL